MEKSNSSSYSELGDTPYTPANKDSSPPKQCMLKTTSGQTPPTHTDFTINFLSNLILNLKAQQEPPNV